MANQTGLEPASAIVQLQNLRVQEATDGVTLARKQNAKADFGADQYGNLIRAGLNSHAGDMLQSCWQFKTLRDVADIFGAAIGIAQMAGQVASIDKLFTRSGGHQAAARVPAVGYVGKAIGGGFIDNAQARLDSDTLLASHENRVADWNATGNLHSIPTIGGQLKLARPRMPPPTGGPDRVGTPAPAHLPARPVRIPDREAQAQPDSPSRPPSRRRWSSGGSGRPKRWTLSRRMGLT
jgi:hypothetical protein